MDRPRLSTLIADCLKTVNQARPEDKQIPLDEDTCLFGADGHLDSMGLVSLLLDIEDSVFDQGFEIALSDERAMSQQRSPFRTIGTLTDYTYELIREQA